MTDTTRCPECGETAEVEYRMVLDSTDGPIEHAKIACRQRHWFFLPLSILAERQRANVTSPHGGRALG